MSKFLDEIGLSYFWSKIKAALSTVAFTGSYNDLLNKPTIPPGAVVDSSLSSSSENPVQNQVIYSALDNTTKNNAENVITVSDWIYRDTDSDFIRINGGTVSSGGATLTLNGPNASGGNGAQAGRFVLAANNGTSSITLKGQVDGTLQWGNTNVSLEGHIHSDYAVDSTVVHISGSEIISGIKTFASGLTTNTVTLTGNPSTQPNNDTSVVRHRGGTSADGGAQLVLCGTSQSTNPGQFRLWTGSGSSGAYNLTGDMSGRLSWDGTLDLTNTLDASGSENKAVALRIGAVSAQHLAFDGNEIMAKSDGSSPSTLYLNNDGGLVSIGNDGLLIKGAHTTVGSPGVIISGAGLGYAQQFQNTNITKGTTPTANQNTAIEFYGTRKTSYKDRIAWIETTVGSNGVNTLGIKVYGNASSETTAVCTLSVNVDSAGSAYTYAPTPTSGDSSTKIATTAFVRGATVTSAGNATTVNGFTVSKNVPSDANFSNTTYSAGTAALLSSGTDTVNRVWQPKILSAYIAGATVTSATNASSATNATSATKAASCTGNAATATNASSLGGVAASNYTRKTTHIQGGTTSAVVASGGSMSSGATTDVKIIFPTSFGGVPNVVATMRGGAGAYAMNMNPGLYAVTKTSATFRVKNVGGSAFTATADSYIDWIATYL